MQGRTSRATWWTSILILALLPVTTAAPVMGSPKPHDSTTFSGGHDVLMPIGGRVTQAQNDRVGITQMLPPSFELPAGSLVTDQESSGPGNILEFNTPGEQTASIEQVPQSDTPTEVQPSTTANEPTETLVSEPTETPVPTTEVVVTPEPAVIVTEEPEPTATSVPETSSEPSSLLSAGQAAYYSSDYDYGGWDNIYWIHASAGRAAQGASGPSPEGYHCVYAGIDLVGVPLILRANGVEITCITADMVWEGDKDQWYASWAIELSWTAFVALGLDTNNYVEVYVP